MENIFNALPNPKSLRPNSPPTKLTHAKRPLPETGRGLSLISLGRAVKPIFHSNCRLLRACYSELTAVSNIFRK